MNPVESSIDVTMMSPATFDDDDMEVAGILLQLRSLISAEETRTHGRARSSFVKSWGGKRKLTDAFVERPEASSLPSLLAYPTDSDERAFMLPGQITESRLEIRREERVPQYVEMKPELSAINRDERGPQNYVEQQNQQELTMEPEVITEETLIPQNNVEQQNQQQLTMEPEIITEETLIPQNNVEQLNQQQLTMEPEIITEDDHK